MRGGGSAAALLLCATMAFLASACGSRPSPPASATPVAAGPTPTRAPVSPTPATSDTAPSHGAQAAIDPTLLDALPDEVGGLPVQPSPEALADAVTDPAIVRDVEALAAGIVVDPASGEFAYATVIRFFDGVWSDGFYRNWRDTFDAGVCEQAGGVSGTAEAEIGGRQVFIGSCAGGAHTYHAWLGNRGVLVSVSAVGAQRLGEQLVEDLRD
jgi:hypothetical protein